MAATTTIVFEDGTLLGAMNGEHDKGKLPAKPFVIPEIVISSSYSSNSLQRSRCDMSTQCSRNSVDDAAAESTALLKSQPDGDDEEEEAAALEAEEEVAEFEEFVLNRSTSESNMLESSIYSELQFPYQPPSLASLITTHSQGNGSSHGNSNSHGVVACMAGPQAPTSAATEASIPAIPSVTCAPPSAVTVVDMLNTSASSRSESRQSKRMRRKAQKSKSKCNSLVAGAIGGGSAVAGSAAIPVTGAGAAGTTPVGVAGGYPPQYTTIFLDAHHHHHGSAASGAIGMGQIANAAASSPFLNASSVGSETASYLQYHQCYQQHPIMATVGHQHSHQHQHQHHHLHHARRALLDVAVPLSGTNAISAEGVANLNSTTASVTPNSSELSSTLGYSLPKWFARPSLPFVIGIFALGGVACTLGGIVLGSTGLIEHSTQYLSAALLMIGIGVSLLVISGAIWRLSLPDDNEECPCFRRLDTCRGCNSAFCNNRLMPGSYLYPEFQHRPPPPSYLTSLNEYAFVYHPGAGHQAAYVRVNTPPPLYRSTYSLNGTAPLSLSTGINLQQPSEFNTTLTTRSIAQPGEMNFQNPTAIVFTREAVSQTSFKECELDELGEMPCVHTREAVSQTSFKELDLD